MQWYRLRFKVILASLLATLAVLFGGQWLYLKYSLQQPLREIMAADSITYRVEDGATLKVYVRLKKPSDLMHEYRELDEKLRSALRDRPYQLIVEDRRSAALNEAFYRSQFAIYTAIAGGNFENMAEKVKENAAAVGAQARVWLDGQHVYVYMWKDDRYLVEVIPRVAPSVYGEANGGRLYVQRD
ncbi:MAG: hypothetical protein AB1776_00845 [Bacillota bacterium]